MEEVIEIGEKMEESWMEIRKENFYFNPINFYVLLCIAEVGKFGNERGKRKKYLSRYFSLKKWKK